MGTDIYMNTEKHFPSNTTMTNVTTLPSLLPVSSSSFHSSSSLTFSIPSTILNAFEVTQEEVEKGLLQEEEYVRNIIQNKLKLNTIAKNSTGVSSITPPVIGRSLRILDEPYRKLIREETGFPAFLGLVLFQRIVETSALFDSYLSLFMMTTPSMNNETVHTTLPSVTKSSESTTRLPKDMNESLYLSRIEYQRQLSRKRCMDEASITILDWLRVWPIGLSVTNTNPTQFIDTTKLKNPNYLRALRLSLLMIPSPSPFIIHTVLDIRQKLFTTNPTTTIIQNNSRQYCTLLSSILTYQYSCTGKFSEFYLQNLPYSALRQRWFYHDPMQLSTGSSTNISLHSRNIAYINMDLHSRVRAYDIFPIVEALIERHPDLTTVINNSIITRQRYLDFVTSALMMAGLGTCTPDITLSNFFSLSSKENNHVVESIYLTAISYLSEVPLFNPALFKHFDNLFMHAVHDTHTHERNQRHRAKHNHTLDVSSPYNGKHMDPRLRSSSSGSQRNLLSRTNSASGTADYTAGSYLNTLATHSKLNHVQALITPVVFLPENEIINGKHDPLPTVQSPETKGSSRSRSVSLSRGLSHAADRIMSVLRAHDTPSSNTNSVLYPSKNKPSKEMYLENKQSSSNNSSRSRSSSRSNPPSPLSSSNSSGLNSLSTSPLSLGLSVTSTTGKDMISLPNSIVTLLPLSSLPIAESIQKWYQNISPAMQCIFTLPCFAYPPSLLTNASILISETNKKDILELVYNNQGNYNLIYESEMKEWDIIKQSIINSRVDLTSVHRIMDLHISKVILERVFYGYGRTLHPDSRSIIDQHGSVSESSSSLYLSYKDMIYLYHAVNDRMCTSRSISYWYKLLDIDGDNYLSVHDCQAIYEGKAWELRNHNSIKQRNKAKTINNNLNFINSLLDGSDNLSSPSARILEDDTFITSIISPSSNIPNNNNNVLSTLPTTTTWGEDILTSEEIYNRILHLLPTKGMGHPVHNGNDQPLFSTKLSTSSVSTSIVSSKNTMNAIDSPMSLSSTSTVFNSSVHGFMTMFDIQRDKIGRILFDLLIAIPSTDTVSS